MKTNQILSTVLARKGAIATFITQRPLKVRKGEQPIIKTSEFQARIGVNYDNIAAVQEKRENGELPAQNAGLPWGQWVVPNYIISHNDALYVRCTTVNNDFNVCTVYTRDGVLINASEAKRAALASEFSSSDSEVFNIKLNSVVEVR